MGLLYVKDAGKALIELSGAEERKHHRIWAPTTMCARCVLASE